MKCPYVFKNSDKIALQLFHIFTKKDILSYNLKLI